MVCRLNLTEREPPKQLNPINITPLSIHPPHPPSSIKLLNTLVLKLGQVIINTRRCDATYHKQPIIEELHMQGCPYVVAIIAACLQSVMYYNIII